MGSPSLPPNKHFLLRVKQVYPFLTPAVRDREVTWVIIILEEAALLLTDPPLVHPNLQLWGCGWGSPFLWMARLGSIDFSLMLHVHWCPDNAWVCWTGMGVVDTMTLGVFTILTYPLPLLLIRIRGNASAQFSFMVCSKQGVCIVETSLDSCVASKRKSDRSILA